MWPKIKNPTRKKGTDQGWWYVSMSIRQLNIRIIQKLSIKLGEKEENWRSSRWILVLTMPGRSPCTLETCAGYIIKSNNILY